LLNPLYLKWQKNAQSLIAIEKKLVANTAQITLFSDALTRDYTQELRSEIATAELALKQVDEKLNQFSQGFVPPYKMAAVLKKVLLDNRKLTLKAFKLVGVEPIIIGLEQQQKVAFYEHGMAITLEGEYFDLLKYLNAVQNLEEKLFIKEYSYQVIQYPIAQLSLVITTVSADEEFLSI
jgi:MSHA biogenesis protein MshJ